MEMLALCPAAKLSGNAGAVIAKADPESPTWEITILGPPAADEFVSVMEMVLVLPTDTFPKSSEEELRVSPAA